MSHLRRIHAMRREVGLDQDDEAWRDLLERNTGQRSSKGLNEDQAKAVIADLQRLGGGRTGQRKSPITGPYAPKLRALWIACWNLNLVRDRRDEALVTFARRQSGIAHVHWLRNQADAVKVVEALKSMLSRAGVDWTQRTDVPGWQNEPHAQVTAAQWRVIGHHFGETSMTAWLRDSSGIPVEEMRRDDWIAAMNNLGRKIRAEQPRPARRVAS